jgi:hypothetical protein
MHYHGVIWNNIEGGMHHDAYLIAVWDCPDGNGVSNTVDQCYLRQASPIQPFLKKP